MGKYNLAPKEAHIQALVPKINDFMNVFKDKRLILESSNGIVSLEVETGTPVKPVLFLGMVVDLVDGMMYYDTVYGADSVKIGYINDFMSYFTGNVVSRDAALMGVEKFKLTGNLTKMFDLVNTFQEGSIISATINARLNTSVRDQVKKISDFFDTKMRYFRRSINRLVRTSYDKDDMSDEAIAFRRELGYIYDGMRLHSDGKNIEETMFRSSTPLAYEERLVSYNANKQALLASNIVDICEAMDDADDVVLSTDLKNRLKSAGVDKILNGRELSSITANPAYVKVMKDSWTADADLSKVVINKYSDSRDSKVYDVMRNSIKMITKMVLKIKVIKEGA